MNVAHADLAGQQQPEDAQPGRVGERLEQRFPSQPVAWPYIRLDKYITDAYSLVYSLWRILRREHHGRHSAGSAREVRRHRGIGHAGVDQRGGCCGPTACGCGDPITSNLYSDAETSGLPADAVAASLGCGNPTALLALEPGQTVLDLGSGGGIDVLLSAKRVGPTGKVYGLDMTDEMLALARENQRKAGATNVEFLKGTIEAIPLPDNSVDVIISNCVINLSTDKDAVLREAFRVLKPGGRFAVSDVVVRGEVPADVRRSMELWVGCIAGALRGDGVRDQAARGRVSPTSKSSRGASTTSRTRGRSWPTPASTSTGWRPPSRTSSPSAFVRARKPRRRAAADRTAARDRWRAAALELKGPGGRSEKPPQCLERRQHLAIREVGVPAARVRQHEHPRALEALRLKPERHRLAGAPAEHRAKQRDADERDDLAA